jgi:hypothetical protein
VPLPTGASPAVATNGNARGISLRAQFQSSNFGTHTRVAESRQHKNDDDLIFLAVIVSVRASA